MTIALVALSLLLALAIWSILALARQVRSQQRQLDLADQQLAAKDQRIELLIAEQALLNGRHELLQWQINRYITSIPKANKTHARRQAAERNMN